VGARCAQVPQSACLQCRQRGAALQWLRRGFRAQCGPGATRRTRPTPTGV